MTAALVAIVILASIVCSSKQALAQDVKPVFVEDFENPSRSSYVQLMSRNQLSIAKGQGVNGGNALRASYEPYEKGSRRMTYRHQLPPALEYTLNYDVKFESDFVFTHGGKLHGLGPKRPVTGGDPMHKKGWSARANFAKGGGIKTYNYHQNQPGKYGQGGTLHDKDFCFPKNEWVAVSLHVRVNENPNEKTGFSKAYVNGKLIESINNVQWRGESGDDTLINNFLFSTFHGGSTEKWTPKDKAGNWITVHALFDNFAVYPNEHIRKMPGEK